MHARVEKDWTNLCKNDRGWYDRRCLLREDEIAASLKKHGVKPGSVLHVASGAHVSELPTLCKEFKCFQTGPLLEALLANATESDDVRRAVAPLLGESTCLTREVKAVVEFWTATHATTFFGNYFSSFSIELAAEMEHQGKEFVWLNDVCQEGAECM